MSFAIVLVVVVGCKHPEDLSLRNCVSLGSRHPNAVTKKEYTLILQKSLGTEVKIDRDPSSRGKLPS